MCGILGIVVTDNSILVPAHFRSIVDKLFKLSESRGKESAGFPVETQDEVRGETG